MSDTMMVAERTDALLADTAVVMSVYDAFARGDVPKLFDLFAADGVICQSDKLPWGGQYEGHEGLSAFLGKLTGTIASAVTTERFIDDEAGHVVAVGFTRGHVLATGLEFDIPEVHVWTIEHGQIKRFDSYVDTRMMREALGI